MSTKSDDLIRDLLARVLAVIAHGDSFTEAQALLIEEQVRHDWRGEEYYVAGQANSPNGRRHREAVKRDAIAAVEQGVPAVEAAKKHGLGRATLYRLLKHK